MGGGDLNMKKSWHPLLLKNQERVWLEEKKALEEKKKLDQLRKEKEEERQLQELQRLQEEQTGKKRTEKLEWMYSTPATGTSTNANDLEDYLLGKKRVDKLLIGDENAKLGASHKNFIAVQSANTPRDIASKVREDPLLAMKQQEQAAYHALIANPLRLRELQERSGIKPKKKEKKKREKKQQKEKEKERERGRSRTASPFSDYRRRRSLSYDGGRSRFSPGRLRSPGRSYRDGSRYNPDECRPRRSRSRSRSRTPDSYRHRRDDLSRDRGRGWPRSDESEGHEHAINSDSRKRRRYPSPGNDPNSHQKRPRVSPPPSRPRSSSHYHSGSGSGSGPGPGKLADDAQLRAARLAAMQSDATSMGVERQKRLLVLLEKEKAQLEAENRARDQSNGMGGFLSQEQKKVYGGAGDLEDRIKRGRQGLVVDAD